MTQEFKNQDVIQYGIYKEGQK